MELTAYRWAPLLIILTTGCSSSGLFGGRAPEERNSTANAFESRRDQGDAAGDRSPGSRRGAGAGRQKPAVDTGLRRQKVATQLAAATRFENAGDSRAARTAYERVLELEPAHSLANYQLAVLADDEGRFDEAEAHYRILLSKTPKNPDLLASLGWSYFLQGRYDESERTLREALAVDAQHPTALYNLGWLYGTLGDYDQALAIFRTAGTEKDAARAMAELFPRGRPASAPETPSGAPRNPFKPPTDNLASGKAPERPGLADRMASGPISAPAPWLKPSDRPIATGAAPRARLSGQAVQTAAAQNAGRFDEVFSELDSHSGSTSGSSSRPPAEDQVKSLAPPPEFLDAPRAAPGAIETAAYDQNTGEPRRGPGPVITPRKSPAPGALAMPETEDAASSASPGSLPETTAAPGATDVAVGRDPGSRSLPDWPYRSGASGAGADRPRAGLPARPSTRAAAAQLGLSIGPGGLLFPIATDGASAAQSVSSPGSRPDSRSSQPGTTR
jgi:thioredoxin-like negative regulator of GroEL